VSRRRVATWLHGLRRGRKSVQAQHDRVAQAILVAATARDEHGVRRMLHPGVALTVDGGGVVAAPDEALQGASAVGEYLSGVLFEPQSSLSVRSVNGLPGVVVCQAGTVTGVLGIRVRDGAVVEAWLVVNPAKLTRWRAG
jgi:RNA polymerase sigma-70 factor (ECF subfamily)